MSKNGKLHGTKAKPGTATHHTKNVSKPLPKKDTTRPAGKKPKLGNNKKSQEERKTTEEKLTKSVERQKSTDSCDEIAKKDKVLPPRSKEDKKPASETFEANQGAAGSGKRCAICHDEFCYRIRLRNCAHIVCIACLIQHLTHWIGAEAKVLIRCPAERCLAPIHENDICAVLDEKEPFLDNFMDRKERVWLQYTHNKDSIYTALEGGDVKRCPCCKAIYTRREGCNYVQCANSACRADFCWLCNEPVAGMSHYTGMHE